MKLAPIALLLVPLAATEVIYQGGRPFLNGEVLEQSMHTDSPFKCGVVKGTACALKNPLPALATMNVWGTDQEGHKIFDCTVVYKRGASTVTTCCDLNGEFICDVPPEPYEERIQHGEKVIAFWLRFETENYMQVNLQQDVKKQIIQTVSNGLSGVRIPVVPGDYLDIVNTTVEGTSGFKFCFNWGCQAGTDGRSLC